MYECNHSLTLQQQYKAEPILFTFTRCFFQPTNLENLSLGKLNRRLIMGLKLLYLLVNLRIIFKVIQNYHKKETQRKKDRKSVRQRERYREREEEEILMDRMINERYKERYIERDEKTNSKR